MVQITIADDLARAIVEAGPLATLVDSRGRLVAHVALAQSESTPLGMTEEHWTEIKRRMAADDGTRHNWAEVTERLRILSQREPDVTLAL